MDKYLGLDLGTTTLGIVYSDTIGIVHNKENFTFKTGNYKAARERVVYWANKLSINKIVIGFPLQLDRKEGERCLSVRRFVGDLLKMNENFDIIMFDESFTTIEARSRLRDQGLKEKKIKQIIDMASAYIILEDYLRSQKNESNK